MKRLSVKDIKDNIKTTGRCFYHAPSEVYYFNWTDTALEFDFKGESLGLEFKAMSAKEFEGVPGDTTAPWHLNWPVIRIYVDDKEVVHQEISQEKMLIQVPETNPEKISRIRIIKLTENLKTQLGLTAVTMDDKAVLSKPETNNRKSIEFIGDSITCGFGNGTLDRDKLYFTEEEDGELSHAYLAAKELDMDYSVVSISGICASFNPGIPMEYAMNELYDYTDRVIQDKLGETAYEKYDFAGNKKDYVVINLGTNDAHGISYQDDYEAATERVHEGYLSFLKQVRNANGKDTHIICALGSMGYYLYADILELVKQYKAETGDENISCFRYMQINPFDGFGACGHPSAATQIKMGKEIAAYIRTLEERK